MAKYGKSRIPVDAWLAKIEKVFAPDTDPECLGYSLGSYKDSDERGVPLYDNRPKEAVLASVRLREQGCYVLLDEEGGIVSECAIGQNGFRQDPQRYSQERVQASIISIHGEQWERVANTHERNLEKLQAKYDKLEERFENERDLNREVQGEMLKLQTKLDEAHGKDKWEGLVKRGFDVVEGHIMQAKAIKFFGSRHVFGRLSEQAQGEVMKLLNDGSIYRAVEAENKEAEAAENDDDDDEESAAIVTAGEVAQ